MEVVARHPVRGLVPAAARAPTRAGADDRALRSRPSCSGRRSSSRARSTWCSGRPDRLEPMRAHAPVDRPEDRRRLSRARGGQPGLRAAAHPPVRGAAVPRGLVLPRGGTWQAEDVHEETAVPRGRPGDRRRAVGGALLGGREPALTPGRGAAGARGRRVPERRAPTGLVEPCGSTGIVASRRQSGWHETARPPVGEQALEVRVSPRTRSPAIAGAVRPGRPRRSPPPLPRAPAGVALRRRRARHSRASDVGVAPPPGRMPIVSRSWTPARSGPLSSTRTPATPPAARPRSRRRSHPGGTSGGHRAAQLRHDRVDADGQRPARCLLVVVRPDTIGHDRPPRKAGVPRSGTAAQPVGASEAVLRPRLSAEPRIASSLQGIRTSSSAPFRASGPRSAVRKDAPWPRTLRHR